MRFGIFMAPFHRIGENPRLCFERDLKLIEWLDEDELLEITPESTRFRKKILDPNDRHRAKKKVDQMASA